MRRFPSCSWTNLENTRCRTIMICHATIRVLGDEPPHFSKDGVPHDSPYQHRKKKKKGARERERERAHPTVAV